MNKILKQIIIELNDSIYQRKDFDIVNLTLKQLDVKPSDCFKKFYEKYEGPFWSEVIGCELMDLGQSNPSILTHTIFCRERYGFDSKFLILTELNVNQFAV